MREFEVLRVNMYISTCLSCHNVFCCCYRVLLGPQASLELTAGTEKRYDIRVGRKLIFDKLLTIILKFFVPFIFLWNDSNSENWQ